MTHLAEVPIDDGGVAAGRAPAVTTFDCTTSVVSRSNILTGGGLAGDGGGHSGGEVTLGELPTNIEVSSVTSDRDETTLDWLERW